MALRSFRELSSAGLLVVEAAPPGLTDRSRTRRKLHSRSLEAGVPLNAAYGIYSVSVREGLAKERINIAEKFARFSEQWQPKIVAELNGQEVGAGNIPVAPPRWCGRDVSGLARPLSRRVPGQDCRTEAGRARRCATLGRASHCCRR